MFGVIVPLQVSLADPRCGASLIIEALMTLARYFLAVLAGHLRHRWQTPSGYREVLLLAWPLVLSTGSHTIQQFVNRVFLSWYSRESFAISQYSKFYHQSVKDRRDQIFRAL